MTAKDRSADPAAPTSPAGAGYRTLVPGKGAIPAAEPPVTPPAKPVGLPAAAVPAAAVKPDAPKPDAANTKSAAEKPSPDPTRFGDWEIKGRCIDF